MGKVHAHENGSLGPVQVFDASTDTGEVSVSLEAPCRHFSLQVVTGSTSAVLSLTGHLASSGDSTGGITLISWAAATTSGNVLSTESTGPLSRVNLNFSAGASSGGLSAWLAASP